MTKAQRLWFFAVCTVLLCGCDGSTTVPAYSSSEALPAGAATTSYLPIASFELPAHNLPRVLRPDFHAGKALANQPWIKAPTITDARDGLGALYNARTCLACHINGGRSAVPDDDRTDIFGPIVRVSLPGEHKIDGVVIEPMYGDQIQTQSVALFHQLRHVMSAEDKQQSREAPPEAYVYIDWQTQIYQYPDSAQVTLRKPTIRFESLGYGALHPQTLTSLRNAPPIHGMGLLELIPQLAIDALSDPDDIDSNGVSGRVNHVWDPQQRQLVAGRFGLKANRPNLHAVTAGAFVNDVGITNPMFPNEVCTPKQITCLAEVNGNGAEGVELPQHLLDLVVNFTRNLGVPRQRDGGKIAKQGRRLFYETGCQSCHQPSYVTQASAAQSHLGQQTIWPYSDLLLHDMGVDLADGRPDYEASGSEWRTPPLWGIGLSDKVNGNANYLHDGRAQTIEAAILWHGGEALATKSRFSKLDSTQRRALISFVETL